MKRATPGNGGGGAGGGGCGTSIPDDGKAPSSVEDTSDEASVTSDCEAATKRREREWLAPKTGQRATRVGDNFQCVIPELGAADDDDDDEDEDEFVSNAAAEPQTGAAADTSPSREESRPGPRK